MNGPLATPGSTQAVSSRSALVLAPHYDDEVLGCGGLLAQWSDAGAAVRVLFLTDSAGGREAPCDAGYSARRRAEAEQALAVLGVAGAEHLGLPDGELELRLDETAEAIRRALLTQRPDTVLVPSPLEATADHRAAFTALYRVLSPLRGDDPLDAVAAKLDVLVYDVNHPGYPDVLVDVGRQLPRLGEAMACYASQEARHPYLQAALGLRAYRALSLGPDVRGVEGYRRLRSAQFASHGLAALTRRLGGVPVLHEIAAGPLVSVVVRTKDRPHMLREALASLEASNYRRLEIVLVNDGGQPPVVPEPFSLPLVRVDLPVNVGRAGAANAGVRAARGDFIAFLDDDDLVEPDHFAVLAGAAASAGTRVVYSDAAVGVYELQGRSGWREIERRLPYSRDFDPELLLVDNYIPFHTLLIERGLFAVVGELDASLPFFEDWDFLIRLAQQTPFAHLRRVTCEYRHFRGGGHHVLGDQPRERADFLAMKARVLTKHLGTISPAVLARVIDRLRAEQVDAAEAASQESSRVEVLRAQQVDLEGRFHRLNGEVEALRGERQRLLAEAETAAAQTRARIADLDEQARELQRVYGEEARARAAVQEQDQHIGRLHAEIERLNRLLRAMESTRAWRLHSWWHRA